MHENNMPSISEVYDSLFHIHHHTESSKEGREHRKRYCSVNLHQIKGDKGGGRGGGWGGGGNSIPISRSTLKKKV